MTYGPVVKRSALRVDFKVSLNAFDWFLVALHSQYIVKLMSEYTWKRNWNFTKSSGAPNQRQLMLKLKNGSLHSWYLQYRRYLTIIKQYSGKQQRAHSIIIKLVRIQNNQNPLGIPLISMKSTSRSPMIRRGKVGDVQKLPLSSCFPSDLILQRIDG